MKERKQRGRRYSRRDLALEAVRICGYEGNTTLALRIYVAERLSRKEFNEHFYLGKRQRAEKQRKEHDQPSTH